MISSYPDPLPDESLYSVAARYKQRMNWSHRATVFKLHGTRNASISIDFASQLEYLVENLYADSYSVDELIDKHTHLPYYTPFLPPDRVARIREGIRYNGSVQYLTGIIASSISPPEFLRFCPLCVEADRKAYGETYWHRLHQLPGVMVCPIHKIFLESSGYSRQTRRNKNELISADQHLKIVLGRPVNLANRCHQELLKIADSSIWLLNHPQVSYSVESIRKRYLNLLFSRNLCAYRSRVWVSDLLKNFKDYYSSELLNILSIEVNEDNPQNWLSRIVNSSQHTHHPLRHLLLINFLECTPDTFFASPDKIMPFGQGPWLCLNPLCPNFKQLSITNCDIICNRLDTMRGLFCCECGFSYSKKYTKSPEPERTSIRVESYGSSWSNFLTSEEGRHLSIEKVNEQIREKNDGCEVRFSKSSLQLLFPNAISDMNQNATDNLDEESENFENYKAEWLSLLNKNGSIGFGMLMYQTIRNLRYAATSN